jgi:hypothetical protein
MRRSLLRDARDAPPDRALALSPPVTNRRGEVGLMGTMTGSNVDR